MRLVTRGLEALAASSDTVREMDRRTIEEYGLPGIALMENAGSAAAEVAAGMLAPQAGVAVFAGAGNNAGDGFVIARHLAGFGFDIQVILAVPREKYKGDADTNLAVVEKMGLPISQWNGSAPPDISDVSLVVDALLGTGLSGPLRDPFPEVIAFVNAAGRRVLAVDIPSGVDADTGEVSTAAVKAHVTVTFALPKKGLYAGEGRSLAGRVVLADIGMPADVYPEGKALHRT